MRASKKRLEEQVKIINDLTNSPQEYFNGETQKTNIGHYCISGAYGGWQLQRVVNDCGAIETPLNTGFIKTKELCGMLNALIIGLQLGIDLGNGGKLR